LPGLNSSRAGCRPENRLLHPLATSVLIIQAKGQNMYPSFFMGISSLIPHELKLIPIKLPSYQLASFIMHTPCMVSSPHDIESLHHPVDWSRITHTNASHASGGVHNVENDGGRGLLRCRTRFVPLLRIRRAVVTA